MPSSKGSLKLDKWDHFLNADLSTFRFLKFHGIFAQMCMSKHILYIFGCRSSILSFSKFNRILAIDNSMNMYQSPNDKF